MRGHFHAVAEQDLDGAVTLTLGAKGVIELELMSSGEKWGRGPTKDVHSSLQGEDRQPGLASGAGAAHAGVGGWERPAIENSPTKCGRSSCGRKSDDRGCGEATERSTTQENAWA